MICPKDNNEMVLKPQSKRTTFRGVDFEYQTECYVCEHCGLEIADIKQASEIQKNISDAYRRKTGLLTGREIVDKRKKLKISQIELAKRMNVGQVSVKRWERTHIQSKSMDKLLRDVLDGNACGNPYTGNKEFSMGRIKLLINYFETILGRKILKKGDRLLYAAKYAWYADMLSFSERGESITGATYAALPQGPQINNYRDLIDDIRNSDATTVAPLTNEEKRLIKKVAMTFPTDKMVYDASHKEVIWSEKAIGASIPYTDSERLSEI